LQVLINVVKFNCRGGPCGRLNKDARPVPTKQNMEYFFVLGNNPTLSIAEISALQSGGYALAADNVLILTTEQKINCVQTINRLGGTIKIGLISAKLDNANFTKIYSNILPLFNKINSSGKFNFGISDYNIKKLNKQKLGLELKKYLKNKGISSRWVTSREPTLSSVVVEQNKLINKGLELVLVGRGQKILIGQTLAVQPFKQLSFRDYGRPSRDDLSGMLPPKLAQIMINLAKPRPSSSPLLPPLSLPLDKGEIKRGYGEVILDPFCGSGTILTEAMLMGYKNLIGSDISPKAINDTKTNIAWINNNFQLKITNYELFNKDTKQLSRFIKPNSIDAIITEPYLGPQRGKVKINEVVRELNNLYSQSLAEFAKVLKPNGQVVMVWPVFHITPNAQHLMPNINGFKIINPIPKNLQQDKRIKLTSRNTIIYGRNQQKVWREIVVLKKI